jgi:hypothetical protein
LPGEADVSGKVCQLEVLNEPDQLILGRCFISTNSQPLPKLPASMGVCQMRTLAVLSDSTVGLLCVDRYVKQWAADVPFGQESTARILIAAQPLLSCLTIRSPGLTLRPFQEASSARAEEMPSADTMAARMATMDLNIA